jgi:hypothetical protein
MGYAFYVSAGIKAIQEARAAMQCVGQQATARRQALLDDHTFDTGRRGREARDRELLAVRDDALAKIRTERAKAERARDDLSRYLADNGPHATALSPAGLAAAERLRHALAAGADLRDLIDGAIADGDDAALHAAQVGVREYLASHGRKAAALAPALREHIVDARLRLGAISKDEREYHEGVRSLAAEADALEQDTRFYSREAAGLRTTDDLFTHGLTDPKWAAAVGEPGTWDEPAGPIEQANTPEPVEA